MAFCSKCGNQIGENEKFCPSCGAPVQAPAAQAAPQAAPQPAAAPAAAAGPEMFTKEEVESGKVIAILMYICPALFFLPLVMDPKTAYGKFHANQALLLLIGYVVSSILSVILIGFILYLIFGIFAIIGIVNCLKCEKKGLPLIGNITIIK